MATAPDHIADHVITVDALLMLRVEPGAWAEVDHDDTYSGAALP
jgi:hypothetical protein